MIKITTGVENPAWFIYRANCITIGKTPKANKELTYDWCMEQLHAQHSTLEQFLIYIEDDGIRGDVASHIVRHTKGHPRPIVESKRPDWTGQPRPPIETPRKFLWSGTPYALIEMARQRLCSLASYDTQTWMGRVEVALMEHDDTFLCALGNYIAPDCLYRGGVCHQSKAKCCGLCKHWTELDK